LPASHPAASITRMPSCDGFRASARSQSLGNVCCRFSGASSLRLPSAPLELQATGTGCNADHGTKNRRLDRWSHIPVIDSGSAPDLRVIERPRRILAPRVRRVVTAPSGPGYTGVHLHPSAEATDKHQPHKENVACRCRAPDPKMLKIIRRNCPGLIRDAAREIRVTTAVTIRAIACHHGRAS